MADKRPPHSLYLPVSQEIPPEENHQSNESSHKASPFESKENLSSSSSSSSSNSNPVPYNLYPTPQQYQPTPSYLISPPVVQPVPAFVAVPIPPLQQQQQQRPYIVHTQIEESDSRGICSWVGNALWIILGAGLGVFLIWVLLGVAFALTIVFIPFAKQCFKVSIFALLPFGKKVHNKGRSACDCSNDMGVLRILGNILWFPIGLPLSLLHLLLGLAYCLTIIGIPFGLQHFKLAELAFWPFGQGADSLEYSEITFITKDETLSSQQPISAHSIQIMQ